MLLCSGHADGFVSERFEGDSHEGDGNLFAGGHEHIHFAVAGSVGEFVSEGDELVGRFTHCTDNDNDLVSGLCSADGFSSGTENLLRIGNAGSPEFLNDERHS